MSIFQTAAKMVTTPQSRFSGHEMFVCRYSWIPKVVRELEQRPLLFKDEDTAMVRLGVGKNMVRSAKLGGESAGVIDVIGEEGITGTTKT